MLIFQFVLVLTIYGYDIDRIERKPTLVSLLIFTLSLPALYINFQSVGVPEVCSYAILDKDGAKISE